MTMIADQWLCSFFDQVLYSLYENFNAILIQTDFKNLLFIFGTQDSQDSIATATSWTDEEFVSCKGKRFLSSQKRPDQLWGVPTLQRQPRVL